MLRVECLKRISSHFDYTFSVFFTSLLHPTLVLSIILQKKAKFPDFEKIESGNFPYSLFAFITFYFDSYTLLALDSF